MMFNNAIAWANVRLRGGWKNFTVTTGGYALLVGMVFAYVSRMAGGGGGSLSALCTILFSLQLVILAFLGCTAVGNAVRRDVGGGLLASHRLMPVSPTAAVAGYVLGPSLQALLLAGVNVVLGAFATVTAGLDLGGWFAANAVVLLFAAFLWIAVAFMGFISKNAFGGMIGALFASVSGGGIVINFIPALAVVFSPVMIAIGGTLMRGGGQLRLTAGTGYAVIAQLVFGAILYRGAMRRYRRDDVPALGTLLSFTLLGAWVITSAVGVLRWDDFAFRFGPPRRGGPAREIDVATQSVAAIVSCMLVAVAALHASAVATTEWLRSKLTTGHAPARRPIAPPILVLLATVVILPLVIALRPQDKPGMTAAASAACVWFAMRAAIVVAAYLLGISYLLRIIYRVSNKPILILLVWTGVTWLVPLGAEAARRAYLPAGGADSPALFSPMSPLGALFQLWHDPAELAVVGLAVQLGLAAIPAALFYATEPGQREPSGSAAGQLAT